GSPRRCRKAAQRHRKAAQRHISFGSLRWPLLHRRGEPRPTLGAIRVGGTPGASRKATLSLAYIAAAAAAPISRCATRPGYGMVLLLELAGVSGGEFQ